eukprot:416691_1
MYEVYMTYYEQCPYNLTEVAYVGMMLAYDANDADMWAYYQALIDQPLCAEDAVNNWPGEYNELMNQAAELLGTDPDPSGPVLVLQLAGYADYMMFYSSQNDIGRTGLFKQRRLGEYLMQRNDNDDT